MCVSPYYRGNDGSRVGNIEHLVLIDGHHLMYRAYWAIPRTLRTKVGEQVNMVFGVASMLLSILTKEEPDALLFCFDAGEETFRHQELPGYKEGRVETPDDFFVQIPRVMELLDVFHLPHVSDLKFEADDFLCSYARAGEAAKMRVTVVTGDHDALQIVTSNVRVAIPHKGYQKAEYIGPTEIVEKYGIRPDQVSAFKGLMGDASDNLPGVRGVGPKTAAQLLARFESLNGIFVNLPEVRPNLREKLRAGEEQARFCERMATLVCDIPLPLPLSTLRIKELPVQPLLTFFQTMEFTLLERRFRSFLTTEYGRRVFDGSNREDSDFEGQQGEQRCPSTRAELGTGRSQGQQKRKGAGEEQMILF